MYPGSNVSHQLRESIAFGVQIIVGLGTYTMPVWNMVANGAVRKVWCAEISLTPIIPFFVLRVRAQNFPDLQRPDRVAIHFQLAGHKGRGRVLTAIDDVAKNL